MKVLVTGGAGFIGSNYIRHALRVHPDWEVTNFDKLTYAGNLANLADVGGNPLYTFINGDIADREIVDEIFDERRPDLVVNFAAESHVDRSILDAAPFVETNIKGVQVLLEASRQYEVERFLQVSTDEVYGALGSTGVFREEDPLLPNSPYAASKAASELLCRAYFRTYGVPVVITRSSNNYGPYQFPEKLIPLMIHNAHSGKPLPVYGEGEQVRDWVHVEDNCRAIDLVLQQGRDGETYNVGGGEERKNIEVVTLILDYLVKPRSLIQFIEDPRGAAHDFRYALDCSKIEHDLAWCPRVPFNDGLRETVDWYLSNAAWVHDVTSGAYQDYCRTFYGAHGAS